MTTPATKLPPGSKRACQCPTCKLIFSTVSNFDKHRKEGFCVPTHSVGLILNKNGVYITPSSEEMAFRR